MKENMGRPPLMLTSQRLCGFTSRTRRKERDSHSDPLGDFPDGLTEITHSPATHILTITYTHIHPLAQTHCLTGQCELFGFKCGSHHFSSFPDSANRFFQTLLEGFKEKLLFFFFFVLSTFTELVFGRIWFSYPGVVQMQVEVFFFPLVTCHIVRDVQTQVTQRRLGAAGARKEAARVCSPSREGTGCGPGLPRWLLGRVEDFHIHRAALLTPFSVPPLFTAVGERRGDS